MEALRDQGKYKEATLAFDEALGIYQKSPDLYGKDFAWCLLNLGILASDEHEWEETERYLTQSTVAFEKYIGPTSADTAEAVFRFAELRFDQHKYVEAEAAYRKSLSIQESALTNRSQARRLVILQQPSFGVSKWPALTCMQ